MRQIEDEKKWREDVDLRIEGVDGEMRMMDERARKEGRKGS